MHEGRPYWSPYDLLGLMLSEMGPAPAGATTASFYLPLTAVFAKFCSKIAGGPTGGVGKVPHMYQCTWDNERNRFFLGASLGGCNFKKRTTGIWEKEIKQGRFDLVVPIIQGTEKHWTLNESKSQEKKGTGGTPFGHCAETYPFRVMHE